MSATQAKQNQLQGRWLLRQGWVPHQTLTQMLHALQGGAQGDLCGQLLARGLIDQNQANQARQAARQAITGAFNREKATGTQIQQTQSAWDQQAPPRSPLPPPSALIQAPQSFSTRNDSHSDDGSLVNSQANSEELQRSQLKAGDLFRDYEILGEISRGAMGVIFRARHCISDKTVALKFILQDHPDATEVARFRQEAETLIQLDSDHIVQILDFGSDHGRLFYAMELIDGCDFYNVVTNCIRLEAQPPPFRESMRYLRDIAAALAYCHEHNVVHRDVKPQNILIENETERAVLVDFGLRKKLQEDSKGLTKTGEILGTPAFMSPEQFSPGGSYGNVGPATDVWAFGATIFFALAGKSPFEKGTMVEIFQAISIDPPPTLKSVDSSIPDWLDDLCSECLQKQSDARPTMAEVSRRLDEQSLEEPVQSQGIRIALKFLSISAVLLGVVIAGLFLWTLVDDAPLEFSDLDKNPKVTRERSIQLTGRINGATISISAGGGKGLSDENGDFKVRVALEKEGKNQIKFIAQGAEQAVSSTIDIYRDTIAPKIEIPFQESHEKVKIAFVDKSLKGKVSDKSDVVKFTINNKETALIDGVFEYPLKDKAESQSVLLIAEDAVGNKTKLECKVFTANAQLFREFSKEHRSKLLDYVEYRSKSPEDKRALLVLANNQLWVKSAEELQDKAVSIVAGRLGSDFQFVETKKRECGPFKGRIATFKHKKTGIEFQLIPGHLKKTIWWRDPFFEYTLKYLEALASEECNQSLLGMALSIPPSPDFANSLLLFMGRGGTKRPALGFGLAFGTSRRIRTADLPRYRAWFKQRIKLKTQEKLKKEVTEYIPPFLIAKRELSLGQWKTVAALPDPPPGIMGGTTSWSGDPNYPMFCPQSVGLAWLKAADSRFRLPNRHEWMIAAQGGSKKRFFWGDDISKMNTYSTVSMGTFSSPVSTTTHDKQCNAYGLSDVHGNVSEWVDPAWNSWRNAWPKAKAKANIFTGFGDEDALKWGLSMGGYSYTPGPLCDPSMLFFQPILNAHPLYLQRIGMRVSASIP